MTDAKSSRWEERFESTWLWKWNQSWAIEVVWLSRKQTEEVRAVLNGFHTVAEDYFSFDPSLETY